MRGFQLITEEYIQKCVELTPQERLDWLEEYKLLIPISAYDERVEEVKRNYNRPSE